eukprot:TRINITY_DN10703_c0_g1_i1.p1 TRINITY_DN10703_c0_g1~~TRINITY_DN10703_c0_g1_i1.p1  ORF type:complete len:295 (-),score=29.62 TRINITY_DN10703_c0_g1_i1:30-914(-)
MMSSLLPRSSLFRSCGKSAVSLCSSARWYYGHEKDAFARTNVCRFSSSSAHKHKPRKSKELQPAEPTSQTESTLANSNNTTQETSVFWKNNELLRWGSPTFVNRFSYWAGMDANMGFLKDRINPSAYLTFKDKDMNPITVRYQCSMTCYGPKIDFSLRTFGAVMWVNGDTQVEHIPKEIELGRGIELEFFVGFGIVKVVAPFKGYMFYAGGLSGVGVAVFKKGGRLLIDEQYDKKDIRTRLPLMERSYLKPYTQIDRPNTTWSYLKLLVFYLNFLLICCEGLFEYKLDLSKYVK